MTQTKTALVSRQKTYKLVTDACTISQVCCVDLKDVNPNWKQCPYCGTNIEITNLPDIILE